MIIIKNGQQESPRVSCTASRGARPHLPEAASSQPVDVTNTRRLRKPSEVAIPAPQLDLKIGAETPAQRQGPSRGGDPPALHVRPGGGPHGRVGPQPPLRASCHCRPAPWGAGRDMVASHILLQSPSEAAINSPPLVSHGDVRGTGPEGTPPGPPPCASVPGSLSGPSPAHLPAAGTCPWGPTQNPRVNVKGI